MALLNKKQDEKLWLDRFPWRLMRFGQSGGGKARGPLQVWIWWERFTNWRDKVRPIGLGSFLRYSVAHYSGKDRVLKDGTLVRHGDAIIMLHYNNPLITQMIAQNQFTPWRALRLAARDIQVLEEAVLQGNLGDVKAMYGVSLLAATGPRLDFETRILPHSPYWSLVRYFMIGMIALYHPDGWKHASRTRESVWPAEFWLGLETIKQHAAQKSTLSPVQEAAPSTVSGLL